MRKPLNCMCNLRKWGNDFFRSFIHVSQCARRGKIVLYLLCTEGRNGFKRRWKEEVAEVEVEVQEMCVHVHMYATDDGSEDRSV